MAAEISVQATDTGLYLIVTYHSEEGTPYQMNVPNPLATTGLAGIITPSQFTSLEEMGYRRMETIDISQLDTLINVPLSSKGAADYWLTHNKVIEQPLKS